MPNPILMRKIYDKRYPIIYFLRDNFITDRANGAVIGTVAEPGPGTRVGQDLQAIMSITGGRLLFSPTAISAQKYVFNNTAIARAKGGFCTVVAEASANNGGFTFGLDNSNVGRPLDEVIVPNGSGAGAFFNVGPSAAFRFYFSYGNNPIKLAVIQKAAGAFYIIGNRLAHVDNAAIQTPNYVGMGRSTTVVETIYYDDMKVGKILSGVWLRDYGPGRLAIPGAILAGATFTHTANFLMYFQLVNNGTAGSTVIKFRIQDALNYWNVSITSGGVATINEVVAGINTVRATSAAAFDNERVAITVSEANIAVSDTTFRIAYNAAANFQTATSGEVSAIATGADLQNMELYPVDLMGEALNWIKSL